MKYKLTKFLHWELQKSHSNDDKLNLKKKKGKYLIEKFQFSTVL